VDPGVDNLIVQGNVGIGTTAPGNKLSVSGGVGIGTTAPGSVYLSTAAPDGGMIVEGNTGIGNTAPSALFTVGATNQFQVSSAGALTAVGVNSGSGLIQGTGGLTITGAANINATGTSATNLGNSTGVLTVASGGASSWTNTSGNLTLATATSGNILLQSIGNVGIGGTAPSTSPYLFVSSGGNVGIGTTNPTNRFSVNSASGYYSSDKTGSGTAICGTSQGGCSPAYDDDITTNWVANSGGPDWIGYDFGAGNSKAITKYTIQARYTYYSSSPKDFTLQGSNTGAWGGEEVTLDTRTGITWTSATQVQEFTLNNLTVYRYYRINITDVGPGGWNVGTAEVQFIETVSSIIEVTDSGNVIIGGGLQAGGSSGLYVLQNGNVGIGTASPSQKLRVEGRISMSSWIADGDGAVYYNSTTGTLGLNASDVRLKKNIENIPDALGIIQKINGVTFNWKDDQSGAKKIVGVIAQDVAAAMPELTFPVTGADGKEYLSVHYDKLAPLLIEGIKEQQGIIMEHETHNMEQDLEISKQASDVAELQTAVNEKLNIVGSVISEQGTAISKIETDMSDLSNRLSAAEIRLQESENNLATFQSATNDTLSAMLETENMLTEKILDYEDRLQYLEAKVSALTISGGEIPDNVLTKDSDGNVALAGIFEAKGVVAGSYSVKNADPDKRTMGEETILAGESEKIVATIAISDSAKVFVTFENDPGSRFWIEKMADPVTGEFTGFAVKLSGAASGEAKFSWWIIDEK
jgi:hypothetical protein